jgi:hypothetical protein
MAKKKKTGAPKKFNDEMQIKFIELVTDGVLQSKACRMLGISKETVIKERKSNRHFSDQLQVSKNKTTMLAHKSLKAGMVRDWRAAAWWLERTQPERFRLKKEIELKETPILIQDMFDPKALARRADESENTEKD